ncbi:hypothetical protein [Paenibacillus hubeiensis]|uniref:hypothetical protein n=1 Tax=Paenibacillus hubeiensis TaxID=3077330 RepID=UPI0031BB4A7B
MAYKALWNIRHNGKRIAIGETLPNDIKGDDLKRLIDAKAVEDPDKVAQEVAKAKAKKAAEAAE